MLKIVSILLPDISIGEDKVSFKWQNIRIESELKKIKVIANKMVFYKN